MTFTLYGGKVNKNSYKALIAAKYVGIKIDQPDFDIMKDTKSPEFLKMNPCGKAPALKTPQGVIWESNAIARFVAKQTENTLYGKTAMDAAHVEQWIDFSTLALDGPALSWLAPLLYPGLLPYDKKKETAAQESVKSAMDILEQHFKANTYLVTHYITLADVITWCNLVVPYKQAFDLSYRSNYPAVTRWFTTLAHQPNFHAIVGDVVLCETPLKFTPPTKDGSKSKDGGEAKQSTKPQKDTQPKASAPEPSTPAQAEGAPKSTAKPKDPLTELPPSKMIMDSWKRLYSNTPAAKFNEICLNGLWNGADIPNSPTNEHFEGYDPEGYSIWFLDYKYPEENTVNFIVMNKVGGFLQRIDYVRKHAFAAMCILKDPSNGTFPIRGLFLFRGQDIPPIMKEECYDVDLYNWTKVDVTDSAQKKRVESILAEEATIDGLENVEVKIFK